MRAHLDCRPRDNVVTFLHRVWSANMTITTLTSRQFNQDAGGAKKAAEQGPVIITDSGKPAHVLIGIQAYRRVIGSRRKIADLIAMPDVGDIELEIPQTHEHARPAAVSWCLCAQPTSDTH